MNEFEKYQSPLSWRYGSAEMRRIWSEENKRRKWRQIWVALADAQAGFGLVTAEQAADLRAHQNEIDISRALAIEGVIHHDLMAEVKTFAEQCAVGGGIIHFGMTSMDVVDNADALRVRDSLDRILKSLAVILEATVNLVEATADQVVIGFTHLQPAEPTTLGYRLAFFLQDLWSDWENLRRIRKDLKGKGIKGAVGTCATYADLLGQARLGEFEEHMSRALDLPCFLVANQTYPRRQDFQVVSALAALGATLHKFAFDLRLLQSPPIGEASEPFGAQQVGSSAMPFKRNPIQSEKLNSLARWLAQYPRAAWDNAANSLLERTLDDSANRRSTLSEAFLLADELLLTGRRLVQGLNTHEHEMAKNLAIYGPFAAIERILMAATRAGADRQEMHERLRGHSLEAWAELRAGRSNPLRELIRADQTVRGFLSGEEIEQLMQIEAYVGDAPARARELSRQVRMALANQP
jgi:adenylosuccinate lyase